MPVGLLLVVWSLIGSWVVGWIGLWVQSFYFAMRWVGLGQSFARWAGLGWVEEIGPTDHSAYALCSASRSRKLMTEVSQVISLLTG